MGGGATGKNGGSKTKTADDEDKYSHRSPVIKLLTRWCDQLTNPSTTTDADWSVTAKMFVMGLLHDAGLQISRKACRRYVDRLEGLISFQMALIDGPSGLHGHFLSANIDAITLRPMRIHNEEAIDSDPSSHTPTTPNAASPPPVAATTTTAAEVYNLAHITAEGLLRLSSGLHEELHHSLWLYLLMGSRHFVGNGHTLPIYYLNALPSYMNTLS